MRKIAGVFALGFVAISVLIAAPAAQAAPNTDNFKLSIDARTSAVYLFDAGIASEHIVPAVTVTGILSRCVAGADNYGESTKVVQDGRTLIEWIGSPSAGILSCPSPTGSAIHSWPIYGQRWPVHPGLARVTMTVVSYAAPAVSLSVTRWVLIPWPASSRHQGQHLL